MRLEIRTNGMIKTIYKLQHWRLGQRVAAIYATHLLGTPRSSNLWYDLWFNLWGWLALKKQLLLNFPPMGPVLCHCTLMLVFFFSLKGNVSHEEMARTFNCGIGGVLIVSKTHTQELVDRLTRAGEKASVIGVVEKRTGRLVWGSCFDFFCLSFTVRGVCYRHSAGLSELRLMNRSEVWLTSTVPVVQVQVWSVCVACPAGYTRIQGSLFSSDVKMCIGICLVDVTFTHKQRITNTA